jgi:hypothetical protein
MVMAIAFIFVFIVCEYRAFRRKEELYNGEK